MAQGVYPPKSTSANPAVAIHAACFVTLVLIRMLDRSSSLSSPTPGLAPPTIIFLEHAVQGVHRQTS